jgi:hypothetical protein
MLDFSQLSFLPSQNTQHFPFSRLPFDSHCLPLVKIHYLNGSISKIEKKSANQEEYSNEEGWLHKKKVSEGPVWRS